MSRPTQIPATVVTGFLGSGKTTLLNRILSGDHGLKIAVLVNDFGSIDIDAQLIIDVSQPNVISLANGCICCSMQDDLVAVLGNLVKRGAQIPDHVLIESSGVSDPARIVHTLRYPQLRSRFKMDAVIAILDAAHFGELDGDSADLARAQLEVADIVIINKTDLVSSVELEALKAEWMFPSSRILEAEYADVPLDLLLAQSEMTGLEDGRPDVEFRDHDLKIESWSWISSRPVALDRLRAFMNSMPTTVYRAKGIVQLAELPDRRCLVNLVGDRLDLEKGGPWDHDEPLSQLVIIGESNAIQASSIEAALGCGND